LFNWFSTFHSTATFLLTFAAFMLVKVTGNAPAGLNTILNLSAAEDATFASTVKL